ncbi:MAG: DNA helicase UvrD, partial [Nitrospirae bacterium]|nr:DNA helicase UvrD [Nitrospirota bacterium]
DSLEECFEELTPHIYAIETGLSSDPPMNWRLSGLDQIALISNSDAHSPKKLAREANIFDTELSYKGITGAIIAKDKARFKGTIEFFPEEGKYHYDGHRTCKQRMRPVETRQTNGLCPKCGAKVTIGVMHRVDELADRKEDITPPNARPYRRLIPLAEIIAEVYTVGTTTKRVENTYYNLLTSLGDELSILQDVPIREIARVSTPLLAGAIHGVREGRVSIAPGYDGEYGTIKILNQETGTLN